jgi:hypothetical protein
MPGFHMGSSSDPFATGGGIALAHWLAILIYSFVWLSFLYWRLRQRRNLLRLTREIGAIT